MSKLFDSHTSETLMTVLSSNMLKSSLLAEVMFFFQVSAVIIFVSKP